ncbi:MAG: NTP transferase domain-containing protein [Dehalococcoidia bacterium]|nr:NTP transferase domain-containing protein [Dehalococcoidia bacterium]
MKAVILAAGEGKRMHPLTYTRPKVMLPIANRPIMEHLMLEMKKAGIQEFVFVVGYHGEKIREHFDKGEKWDVQIDYVMQRKQLGTAHAVKLAQRFVKDKFLLANGDVLILAEDIRRLLEGDYASLCLIEEDDTSGLGVVEVERSRVKRIHEKVAVPPSNLVNAGLYLLDEDIFSAIDRTSESPRGEYELTDSLQILLDENSEITWLKLSNWIDVSYPWDLLTANELLLANGETENLGTVEENVVLKGHISIGTDTLVRSNCYLVGPIRIGENCEIGPNCYIRPGTTIGNRCHIGSAVEIKNSIVMQGTKIPHHNYIGDSVLGEECNFGAGTKIANLRLDKQEITVANVATRRRKLGAIIGDGVQTGINASINVGSLIGNHTFIGPGATVAGIVLPNSRIF